MSDDWLDIEPPPQKVGLPAVASVPLDFQERVALVESCWTRLSDKQKIFLTALRETRFNSSAASRKSLVSRTTHYSWLQEADYATVLQIWRGSAASEAVDRDRLLARQDDIVETLLTPKPVLHQGEPTGFYEVEAGAAGRNNEVLMKAAGLLKDKEIDVNVGIIGPQFTIQVVQPDGSVLDATPKGVTVELPEADWTDES